MYFKKLIAFIKENCEDMINNTNYNEIISFESISLNNYKKIDESFKLATWKKFRKEIISEKINLIIQKQIE